jgi:hypothetical protein
MEGSQSRGWYPLAGIPKGKLPLGGFAHKTFSNKNFPSIMLATV